MPLKSAQPDRSLVAEGNRRSVLKVSTTGHRRVAVGFRQVAQRFGRLQEPPINQLQRAAKLQDGRGIHDVLGGGSPMQIASALARSIGELLDDRKYGVPYDFRLAPETVLVEHI